MRLEFFLVILLSTLGLDAQNCNLYPENSPCRKACLILESANKYPQGSKQSMELCTKATSLCPELASAWHSLSVPYLKRGDYYNWRKYLDKAVALDPKTYLGYRGACLFEFLHDYESALSDFKKLDLKKSGHLGFNPNGEYNLRIQKGLCYRELGKVDQAISEIKMAIDEGKAEGGVGTYDYLHLAVCYMSKNQVDSATHYMELQLPQYPNFPDTHYYLGLCALGHGDKIKAKTYFEKAKMLYPQNHRKDPYVIMPDQIFLSDIEKQLRSLN